MNRLKLFTFTKGPYGVVLVNGVLKENTAHAYVYYESMKDPRFSADHLGNDFGMFMNDKQRIELEQHLRSVVAPKINNILRKSGYLITDVTYTNQAPHPHLVMMRIDKKPIGEHEWKTMNQKLEAVILALNKPMMTPKLFNKAERKIAPEENQTHRYHLRHRN